MICPKRTWEERVDKEKNIAEVQELLENLKAQYPIPEELAQKELPKVKKGKKDHGMTKVTRWESQRMRSI